MLYNYIYILNNIAGTLYVIHKIELFETGNQISQRNYLNINVLIFYLK